MLQFIFTWCIILANLSSYLTQEEILKIERYDAPDSSLDFIFSEIDKGNYSDYEIMVYIYSLFKQLKLTQEQLDELK